MAVAATILRMLPKPPHCSDATFARAGAAHEEALSAIDRAIPRRCVALPLNPAVREKRFEKHALMDEACSPGRETMLY
jgi:hypothetical protein